MFGYYQVAKNCRTSVEVIEKHYAAHIKTSLDAVAIKVMRKKRNKVEEDNVETPTQAQTGDEETDV